MHEDVALFVRSVRYVTILTEMASCGNYISQEIMTPCRSVRLCNSCSLMFYALFNQPVSNLLS